MHGTPLHDTPVPPPLPSPLPPSPLPSPRAEPRYRHRGVNRSNLSMDTRPIRYLSIRLDKRTACAEDNRFARNYAGIRFNVRIYIYTSFLVPTIPVFQFRGNNKIIGTNTLIPPSTSSNELLLLLLLLYTDGHHVKKYLEIYIYVYTRSYRRNGESCYVLPTVYLLSVEIKFLFPSCVYTFERRWWWWWWYKACANVVILGARRKHGLRWGGESAAGERVGKETEGKRRRRKKERDRDFPGAGRGGARMGRGHQHRNTIVFLTSLTGHARWLGKQRSIKPATFSRDSQPSQPVFQTRKRERERNQFLPNLWKRKDNFKHTTSRNLFQDLHILS